MTFVSGKYDKIQMTERGYLVYDGLKSFGA